jgi:hypothetical protein
MFQKLRERVGGILCRIFMSDDEPALYNAWTIMGTVEKKLLCCWHVKRNWKKHLTGLDVATKDDVYDKLQAVMTTLDAVTFEEGLKALVNTFNQSTSTALKNFAEYFQNYYVHRATEWAYCYRVRAGINTNMHFERMHKGIKYNFLYKKVVTRMDVSLKAIREFLTSKQHDRLISINRGKVTTKDKLLRKRHESSIQLSLNAISESGENSWNVKSATNEFDYYTIHASPTKCHCSLICPQCRVCLHAYTCSCPDNSIRMNMCKHIHLLNRFLEENCASECSASDISNNEGQLVIHTNKKIEMNQSETRAHLSDISRHTEHEDFESGLSVFF